MTIRYFTLIALCLSTYLSAQQQQKIDSILSVMSTERNDTINAQSYLKLTSLTINTRPKEAKDYIEKALNLYKKANNKKGIIKSYSRKANYFYVLSMKDSARFYLNKSAEMVVSTGNELHAAYIRLNIAMLDVQTGNQALALEMLDKNIPVFIKENDSTPLGNAYLLKGESYRLSGYFDIALKECYKALKIHELQNNDYRVAEDLIIIATIHKELGESIDARKSAERAYDLYVKVEKKQAQAQALYFIGDISIDLKEYKYAAEKINQSLNLSKKIEYASYIAKNYRAIGRIAHENKNFKNAIDAYNTSLKLSENLSADYEKSLIFKLLGKSYLESNKYNQALNYFNKSIKLGDSINYPIVLGDAYLSKAKALEKMKKYNDALSNYKKAKNINDNILNIDKKNKISELNIIYETKKKEAEISLQEEEIKTLNVQAKNDKLTKTLYGIGMFSFLAIAGLLYFGFKQRIKKNKIEREKQEEIYRQEIEFKKKELTSQTLHLVQKSTFIQELKENLEKIKKSPELFKVEFRRLVMLLKKQSAEDKDWEVFKSYFSEVHNNFDIKIKQIANDISEKEIRLASFLRMNLSTKEIASMLNVLPDSVLKSKYRLKKKLGLQKEEDLTQFLNTL